MQQRDAELTGQARGEPLADADVDQAARGPPAGQAWCHGEGDIRRGAGSVAQVCGDAGADELCPALRAVTLDDGRIVRHEHRQRSACELQPCAG